MRAAELEAVEHEMTSISPADVETPAIPVAVFVHQGEIMKAALRSDRELLRASGLDDAVVDARAWAAQHELKAAEIRAGAASWKVDQTQAQLLDRRNRAHTLAAQTMAEVRAAAQYAFRNATDDRRLGPCRDQYSIARVRRSRMRAATASSPTAEQPFIASDPS